MCNIAGYTGDMRAAPILIEMLKKQEGFAGGYYSGIATVHEGRIYHAKVVGDIETLLEKTNAYDLPGNTGIIHSRSNSGGGVCMAHPFIGCRGGEETEAYVANGSPGDFGISDDQYNKLIRELMDANMAFSSGAEGAVHMSDVMCQLITKNISDGMNAEKAMEKAFCKMPNCIAGLLLSLTEPDKIFWARINRPMMLSFTKNGAYLATTAMAFGDDLGDVISLPSNSSGYVKKDGFHKVPFEKCPVEVKKITESIFEEAVKEVKKALSEGDMTFSKIEKTLKPLFGGGCTPESLLGYEVLRYLKEKGEAEFIYDKVEGAAEGISAPRFKITGGK